MLGRRHHVRHRAIGVDFGSDDLASSAAASSRTAAGSAEKPATRGRATIGSASAFQPSAGIDGNVGPHGGWVETW